MPDFRYDPATRFPSVTAAQYRERARATIAASAYPPANLLAMLDALFLGQGPDVAAAHLVATKRDTIAEFDRIRTSMTRRDYLPQAAQVELLAELRARGGS